MFLWKTYRFRDCGLEVYVGSTAIKAFRFAKVVDNIIHSIAVELDMRQPQSMRYEALNNAKNELKEYMNELPISRR